MSAAAPPRLQTLSDIEAALWRELRLATQDKLHEWRTPVLATIDGTAEDALPDARTVVLREVQADEKQLVFFSDARAGKQRQLLARPSAVLVMWSPRLSWQLRLRLQVEVHSEGLAATSRWALLRASPAARDYLAPLAPGALLPLPADADAPPGSAATEQREHFAVLLATVQAVDWLELHPQGHRRAAFDALGARWLVP